MDNQTCYNCKHFFNTEREALDKGYCMEHENFVKYNHEICSWFEPERQSSDKSPSPCRHTLEDGADTTTELVSGKSRGFIGGMQ